MAVTIADVARRAGVSRSTVSYVLSGSRPISPETRRRVEQAIEELQFRPHAGARSIRSGRNGVIAMALPMVHGPHNQVQMPYVWAALTAAQANLVAVLSQVKADNPLLSPLLIKAVSPHGNAAQALQSTSEELLVDARATIKESA